MLIMHLVFMSVPGQTGRPGIIFSLSGCPSFVCLSVKSSVAKLVNTNEPDFAAD